MRNALDRDATRVPRGGAVRGRRATRLIQASFTSCASSSVSRSARSAMACAISARWRSQNRRVLRRRLSASPARRRPRRARRDESDGGGERGTTRERPDAATRCREACAPLGLPPGRLDRHYHRDSRACPGSPRPLHVRSGIPARAFAARAITNSRSARRFT